MTTRGLGPEHMRELARWIDAAIGADEATLSRIRGEVCDLARAFPPPVSA